ncbi:hypothetical protein [Pseudomonas aeruginosa]|uniref:hypothetical protein n=1 Tax=Pseudomonas aeruginosa TaxID=287 RepID=UPI000AF666F4|nr:hypothetical protein [Pseudomonas aeruginosa]
MNKANECTCPSGDGSLRWPCPAHPAVEQAGGDERDFQAKGAQEVPSPVSKEYDRHLIGLLRKGEALPGHQEEAADEIERLRDWNDHLNNTVLPNILNPNFLMLMKGGERLLDLCTKDGKFIGVSLNDMKDVFDWMVTHARIAPDHAALAQPSPAQAEAEQPEIVAFRYRCTNAEGEPLPGWFYSDGAGTLGLREPLMAVSQHERIIGAMRAVVTQLRQHKNDYMDSGQETYRALQNEIREREAEIARLDGLVSGRTAERDAALAEVERIKTISDNYYVLCVERQQQLDAALARVAELEAKLAELEKQEPAAWMTRKALDRFAEHRAGNADAAASSYAYAMPDDDCFAPLYTTPVAQAQHSAGYAEARQCVNCRHIGINDSAEYAACHDCRWTGPEPDEDKCPRCGRENCMVAACPECGGRYELVAEANITAPPAQAQHCVPEVSGIGRDFAYPRSVVLYLRTEPTDDDLRAIHDGLRSLAAAPGKEGNDD